MSFNCKRIYIAGFNLEQALYKKYFDTLYAYLLQNLPEDWKKETLTENLCQVEQNQFASKVLEHPKSITFFYQRCWNMSRHIRNSRKCPFEQNQRNQSSHGPYSVHSKNVQISTILSLLKHNDANICLIPTDCIGQKLAADLVLHYLKNQFDNEVKNKLRIGLIHELEAKYLETVKH